MKSRLPRLRHWKVGRPALIYLGVAYPIIFCSIAVISFLYSGTWILHKFFPEFLGSSAASLLLANAFALLIEWIDRSGIRK